MIVIKSDIIHHIFHLSLSIIFLTAHKLDGFLHLISTIRLTDLYFTAEGWGFYVNIISIHDHQFLLYETSTVKEAFEIIKSDLKSFMQISDSIA